MNCPNCGKEINATDKFCMGCGSRVNSNTTNVGNTGAGMSTGNSFNGASLNGALNSFMGTSRNGVNFMVRRYFFGFGDLILLCILMMIISFYFAASSSYGFYMITGASVFWRVVCVIAGLALIVTVILHIYIKVIGMGKKKVDQAVWNAIETFKARSITKFNVDAEQVKEVEPIVLAGVGESPNEFYSLLLSKLKRFNIIRKIYTKDPVEAYRIGFDGIARYLLIQTTVFAFTDTQLLVYTGNMDIATGVIYDETVHEVFYKDINSIAQREILKKFKKGLFRKGYFNVTNVEFDICGIAKIASLDSRFEVNANTKASLSGMANYIREKKF